VKKCLLLKGVLVLILIGFFGPAFAAENDTIKIQGTVMHIDLKMNTVTLNEKVFFLDRDSVLEDEKGRPMKSDQLRSGSRVVLEGVKDKTGHRNRVCRICLLPK
jgi:hypothetical protein